MVIRGGIDIRKARINSYIVGCKSTFLSTSTLAGSPELIVT